MQTATDNAARPTDAVDDASDRLSPIVVKEVRQFVRGREFVFSFAMSLVVALIVAFYASTDALNGSGTTGTWTFAILTGCLALLGFAVVPLGAFGALRAERMELTLDLISLTALSPRRIVTGKLLAQGAKLVTLFAVMGPFIAMSFLLGGIDFVTIVVTLASVFMWSMWVAAAALFLSTLIRTRAMSGMVVAGLGLFVFLLFGVSRLVFLLIPGLSVGLAGLPAARQWSTLVTMTVFCGATMVNLVLLAENRLTLPTENRVMPLRLGFLVQFLLIVTWAVRGVITGTGRPAGIAALEYIQFLGVIGGFHLAVVAMFTVTELGQPGAATSPLKGRWRAFNAILGPGTGPAALYVLAQMGVLLVTGVLLQNAAGSSSRSANWHPVQWLFVICGFIALYTGVPTLLLRTFPRMRPFQARVAVLLLVALAEVLPDLIYYVVSAADSPLAFSARHLLSPLRTLFNWETVLARGWQIVPEAMGAAGLLIYVVLIANGARPAARAEPVSLELRATESNTGDSRLD